MPSGRVHALATMTISVIAPTILYQKYGRSIEQSLAVAGGCMAGLLLTPDLDVYTGCVSQQAMRRSSFSLGLIWSVIWRPYAMIIPHRSPLSHLPIIGTSLRLVYLAGMVTLLWWLASQVMDLPALHIPHTLPVWFPNFFIGLVLSDLTHFILDNTF